MSDTFLVKLKIKGFKWTLFFRMAHHLTVKRLAFRPYSKRFQLASCGEDHLVRVYEIEDE